jgi:hypothetical protein
MTCYQSTNFPSGFTTTGRTAYRTEAECNQACGEGACCEGTSCTVKPQCQCQGEGKTFKGVGTVCTLGMCTYACSAACAAPGEVQIQLSISNALILPSDDLFVGFPDGLPGWSQACIDAFPSSYSGTYILRRSGSGPPWSAFGSPSVQVYKFSNSSRSIEQLWPCDSFPIQLSNQLGINRLVHKSFVGFTFSESGCVFEGGGGGVFSGTSISESCSSGSVSLSGQGNLAVRFITRFGDGSFQVVGGLSGVRFPTTMSITQ